jgi:hypothetical protein
VLPVNSILSQFIPFHILSAFVPEVLTWCHCSHGVFPWGFLSKILYIFFDSLMCAPYHLVHPPWFNRLKVLCEGYKLWNRASQLSTLHSYFIFGKSWVWFLACNSSFHFLQTCWNNMFKISHNCFHINPPLSFTFFH